MKHRQAELKKIEKIEKEAISRNSNNKHHQQQQHQLQHQHQQHQLTLQPKQQQQVTLSILSKECSYLINGQF